MSMYRFEIEQLGPYNNLLGAKPIVPAKQHKVGAIIGRVLIENLNGLNKVKHQLAAAFCDNLLCSYQCIVYDKL